MLRGMSAPPTRAGDVAHELTSSLSALLLGLQRLRTMTGGPDRERALALLERMETAVRGMAALLESLQDGPPPPHDS